MPKLTKAQQEQRRLHILDAAELCFARAGFHQTRMQDICRHAGISAGALYLYFNSKEALIEGIVGRDREEIAAEMRRVDGGSNLMGGLGYLLQSCVLDRPPHKAALYVEMLAEACRNPAIARAVSQCEATLLDALAGLLRQNQLSGTLTPASDVAATARLLLLIGDGMMVLMARKGRAVAEALVPQILAMIEGVVNAPPLAVQPQTSLMTPALAGAAE